MVFLDYFTAVVPSIKELSEEMTAKLKQICRNELLESWLEEKLTDPNNPVTIHYKALTVLAKM